MFIIAINLKLKNNFKSSGSLGMIYCIISIIFQFLILFLRLEPYIFSLISELLLFVFLSIFLNELKSNPIRTYKTIKTKKKSYFKLFFKSFLFIIIIANILFIGTIGIHELGHFTLSRIYSCENVKIIFEGGSPYTEALCKNSSIQRILLLGGFLPFIIALFLFIFGGKLLKDISILMTGFNLIVLYDDFVGLGISNNLIIFSILIGIIVLVIGIMLLAKSSVNEYIEII